MNTDAHSQNNALLNRMILLVLSLILVCLVLLVVRAYTNPSSGDKLISITEVPVNAEEAVSAVVNSVPPAGSPGPPPRPVSPAPTRTVTRAPVLPPQRPHGTATDETPLPQEGTMAAIRIDSSVIGLPPVVVASPGVPPDLANADILGLVTLIGPPPNETPIPLTPACGRINKDKNGVTTRHYVVNSEGRLANVLVYVSAGIPSKYPAPGNPVGLDQIGCMYQPYVLGLQTRQPLLVRNSDAELHNVHFTPRNNPERNFVEIKGQVSTSMIENPELLLRIKCDIHPWMFAYLGVFDHPFFSVTGTNGVFHLPNGLPAGHYTVTAAHLKAGSLSREIDFRPGQQMAVEFQFPVPGNTQARNK